MPAIAVVDDRKADRETVERVIGSVLKVLKQNNTWAVVSDAPPAKERDVLQWLDEHDATVLVTDWKLNEGSKNTRVVNYEADALIREIRSKRPDFPIFVITGFESEARTHLVDVENVLSREAFTKDAKTVIPQMLRAGMRRYNEQRKLLAEMDELSRKVASGKAKAADRTKLKGLQGYFQSELPTILGLDTVLTELEAATDRADTLRKKFAARLQKPKKGK